MSNLKGSNDDSSKKNERFVSVIGFHHNSSTSLTRNNDWIINTGATNYMTYNKYKFDQLSFKCPINTGTIPLSSSLTLKDVLVVPSLNCNLISVKQLTKSHNLSCTFFLLTSFFQTFHTKEKINIGRESGGLYYLEDVFRHFTKG